MANILSKKRKTISFGAAAGLLVGASLIGQVLGLFRTRLVSGSFPPEGAQSTDAYFAAFNIPDFFFFTMAAGALGVAFMPVLADRMSKGDRKGVWELSASLMNLLTIAMAIVGVIMLVFARPLLHYVVAPRLTPDQLDNAVIIMRLIAFNPLLFALSGVLTSVQQTYGRFFFYAIAPLFYNMAIIISIYVFRHNIGLMGLGIGALVGAVLQLIIVCIGNIGLGYRYRPRIMWHNNDFKTILRQLPARSLDQGIDQVQNIIETHLASRLGQSLISFYSYAYTIQTAPILLIGTAISTAAFPRLNNRLSQGRPDLFRRDFMMVMRILLWLVLPTAVVVFFARGYLARLIFGDNAPMVATILGYLTAAIIFRTLYAIVSRWFYSQKDSKTPLLVSIFTIGLNIYLAVVLSRPTAYGVVGLAMAQSIVAFVEVVILLIIMMYRDRKLFDNAFWNACSRIVSVTGFTMVAGYVAVYFLPLGVNDVGIVTLGTKLSLIVLAIFGTHLLMSVLFSLDESRPVIARLKQLILRPIKIAD